MKLRNLRDGQWEIPDLNIVVGVGYDVDENGRTFAFGSDVFDVDDPVFARNLLEQDGNYAPEDAEAQGVADEIAADRERREAVVAADDVKELTAAELIASLDTLSEDELRDVRSKEEASARPRKTVLNRIAELLGEGQEV